MGALIEGDERPEDGLRKKLLDKDRENDKVCISFRFLWAFVLRDLGLTGLCICVVACADSDVASSTLPATVCGSRTGAAEGVQEPGVALARNSTREREVYG